MQGPVTDPSWLSGEKINDIKRGGDYSPEDVLALADEVRCLRRSVAEERARTPADQVQDDVAGRFCMVGRESLVNKAAHLERQAKGLRALADPLPVKIVREADEALWELVARQPS